MFLSAVWALVLAAPIRCRASIAEQVVRCCISPGLVRKQAHLHFGWSEGSEYMKFGSETEQLEWAKRESQREEAERIRRLRLQEQLDLELALALSRAEMPKT